MWMKNLVALSCLVSLAVACIAPSKANGEAFRITSQSASATGQASAFAAQADDASAIYYNAAGMTQLNRLQVSAGTNLVGGGFSFRSPSGATAHGDLNGAIAIPPPSNFYVSARLKDFGWSRMGDWGVGLGIISPFGQLTRYPDNGPFSSAATSAALPLVDIKPTLAFRFNEHLAIGVGADIYTFSNFLGEGQSEVKSTWPGGGAIPRGTPIEVNGKGTAPGFNVSLLYTPLLNEDGKPVANIGIIYRSQATLHMNGEFRVNGGLAADAKTTLVLPQIITGAFAIWPIRNRLTEWKLEFDLDCAGWKSNRNLDVHLSNGTTLPFPQQWRNSFVAHFGTEYKWLQLPLLPSWEVALRGGYLFSQTPVPDLTFNPAVPDADHHGVAIGLGATCKEGGLLFGLLPCQGIGFGSVKTQSVGIDVAYQALLYESRTITGNLNPTVNGTYHSTLHVGAVNVRVNF
jgi:long-chain fatty acid transport protein